MRAVIISSDGEISARLQSMLQTHGFDCRSDRDLFPLSAVTSQDVPVQLAQATILVVMPTDIQRGAQIVRLVRSACDATIIAVGSAQNPKALLTVLREGANEYLDILDLEAELASTLARRQVQLGNRSQGRGRVISLIGACGGIGTSSLAANIAGAMARHDEEAGLIDLRLGLGDQSLLWDLEPKHSVASVCRMESRLDQSMLRHALAVHRSGVGLLASPSGWDDCALVTPKGVRKIINIAKTQFPYVVMDLDGSFTEEQVAAIISSDVLLVVLRPDMMCLKNGRRILETFEALGVPEMRVHAVINRCNQRGQLAESQVRQALGANTIDALPEDAKLMNLASNKGVPIVIDQPKAKIAKKLSRLAERLRNLEEVYEPRGSHSCGSHERVHPVGSDSNLIGSEHLDPRNEKGSADELGTTTAELSL